jgi:tRNA (cmo5U34)-methyltransferase
MRDEVYRDRRGQIVDFVFDDAVAAVFPDMIRRSVPGYETVIPVSGLIVARHMPTGGRCYDLGCSLGATALAILRAVGDRSCRVIGVDNSAPMLERARALHATEPRIEWRHADLREVAIENADAVVMNYTLQFVPPADRATLLSRIRNGLNRSGVLIVSEKVRSNDADEHVYKDELHAAFKRANGYSALEVAQKRAALDNVLIPDTPEEHASRLRAAGFSRVRTWFRCLNWISVLALP